MSFKTVSALVVLFICCLFLPAQNGHTGIPGIEAAFFSESDTQNYQLYSVYDLRDRESFIQLTNTDGGTVFPAGVTVHFQVFDVGNNCIENDFFDTYTPNDTHIYNMRDIQTNNGNPSGVVLPDGSYGIVIISLIVDGLIEGFENPEFQVLLGNFRILDDQGYEYRTNSTGSPQTIGSGISGISPLEDDSSYSFNFNSEAGVVLSDIYGISVGTNGAFIDTDSVDVSNPTTNFTLLDVDLYNLDEIPFSCRNVIYACITEDSPRYTELLEEVSEASVANFEYGINEAIPNSKGGELLCPANVISDGFARLSVIAQSTGEVEYFVGFAGLNNGNGRGSMDSFWTPTAEFEEP